jgi:hypothetical protein
MSQHSQKNIPVDRTDKTDKRGLVSFVSCPHEEKKSLFPNSGRDAIAEPPEHRIAEILRNEELFSGDTSITSWRWMLHFADRKPVEVTFSPEATHAEVLELYPAAVAAEPVPDARRSLAPLTRDEEAAIRGWLKSIGETDPAIVAEILELCQRDSGARGYFLGRAKPEPFDREAFEERAGICEFDGGLSREEAEAVVWHEDDRRPGRERWPEFQERMADDPGDAYPGAGQVSSLETR